MTANSLKAARPADYGLAMLKPALALAALLAAAAPAAGQTPSADYPRRLPSPGGEVIIPLAGMQSAYDEMHYAPARRAGDYLYISGVVAGRVGDEGRDTEAFKAQMRRAFRLLQRTLAASGASFGDVVMVNSFHVWDSPDFSGTKMEQFDAVSAVKDEFMPAPHPAWTAVGTTALLAPGAIVEIQMIAYVPQKPAAR
jgi:enamine deaminase RidA (YjgF/YER057c/UK114 family)